MCRGLLSWASTSKHSQQRGTLHWCVWTPRQAMARRASCRSASLPCAVTSSDTRYPAAVQSTQSSRSEWRANKAHAHHIGGTYPCRRAAGTTAPICAIATGHVTSGVFVGGACHAIRVVQAIPGAKVLEVAGVASATARLDSRRLLNILGSTGVALTDLAARTVVV